MLPSFLLRARVQRFGRYIVEFPSFTCRVGQSRQLFYYSINASCNPYVSKPSSLITAISRRYCTRELSKKTPAVSASQTLGDAGVKLFLSFTCK